MNKLPVTVVTTLAALATLTGCGSTPPPVTAPSDVPTTTASSQHTTTADPAVLGPTGYGDLVLGMPVASALATGQVTGSAHAGYRLRDGSQLCFRPGAVLTAITAPRRARTPQGIHDGSTEAEVRTAFHLGPHPHDLGWAVPAGPGATYHFFITPDHGVTELTLEAPREDCWR